MNRRDVLRRLGLSAAGSVFAATTAGAAISQGAPFDKWAMAGVLFYDGRSCPIVNLRAWADPRDVTNPGDAYRQCRSYGRYITFEYPNTDHFGRGNDRGQMKPGDVIHIYDGDVCTAVIDWTDGGDWPIRRNP